MSAPTSPRRAASLRLSVVKLLLLLLLLVACNVASRAGAAAPALTAASLGDQYRQHDPGTVCALNIQGSSQHPGTLQVVSLSCSGGPPISIAAHRSVADRLNTTTAKGVTWDPQGCENLGCLISICGGSAAAFAQAHVVGMHDQSLAAALCISGDKTNVVFEGSTFSKSTTSQGAVLVVGSGRVSFHGTVVTHNTANSTMGVLNMGGGILVQQQAQVYITDSLFASNQVIGTIAALGAAVAVQDHGQLAIYNSTFRDNTALAPGFLGFASGGAMYAEGSAALEADGVMFMHNLANSTTVSAAGAICVMHNATLALRRCVLANNTAWSAGSGVGGAVAALNSTVLNVTGSSFSSNAAIGASGAGAGGAAFAANHAVLHFAESSFTGNSASGSKASTGGGVCSFDNATVHLSHTLLSGNTVSSISSVLGGGIACFNTSSLLLADSVVIGNSANSSTAPAGAGGVGVSDQAAVHIVRCNLTRNWVKGSGAASGVASLHSAMTPPLLWRTVSLNPTVLCNDTTLVVEDSVFESNSAAASELTGGFASGGGVGASGNLQVALRHNRFLNYHVAGISATDGGAVCGAAGANVVIDTCQFVDNGAAGIPGYMYPSLISCGGAVAVQDMAVMSINSSRFASNLIDGVQTCGGAACVVNSSMLHIYNSHFELNRAAGAATVCGGAVCASDKGQMHIEGAEFDGNTASGVSEGGAACTAVSSNATITSSSFRGNTAGWVGGAVGIGDGCLAAIAHCAFANNSTTNADLGSGGAVSIGFESQQAEVSSCSIDSSTFLGNSALGRRGVGGAVYTANAVVMLSNSTFVANAAQQGGGIGGSGRSWTIVNSTFSNHSVAGPGGAVFALGGLNTTINDSVITGNRGSEGGGVYAAALMEQPFQLGIYDSDVIGNEAQTGGGIFLRAGEAHIGQGTVISNNQASQQAGGAAWVGCGGGQVCTSVLDISCGADISNNTAAVAGGGLFVGQAFNTQLQAPAAECAAEVVHNNSAAFGAVDVFLVRSVCQPGEVWKGGWCDVCPQNMFGFDPHATSCELCPAHAYCPGGDVLMPEPGYWHSTNNSTQMHACSNPAACNHTLDPVNAHAPIDWQCAAGYQGHLCGRCQSQGYGFTAPFRCGWCMPFDKTVGLYAAALICLLGFLSYSAQATWRDNQQPRVAPRVSDTIKTLMWYVNYLLILSSIRVDWPKSLSILYTAAAWLLSSASGQVLSLDCILPAHGQLPLAIQRQLVYLLVPFVMAACVLLVFVLCWIVPALLLWCRGSRVRYRAFSVLVAVKAPTAVLVSLYLFFPSLVRVALGMFTCFKLDEPCQQPFPEYAVATAPFGYWVQDMQQACYEGWHLSWSLGLGLACTLLFCVAMPVGLVWWLTRNRHHLTKPWFHTRFGFLYADFRQDRYWWEACAAARTVALVCIAVFASVVGPYYGLVMFVFVLHLSLVLQLSLCPFAFVQLNHIQLAALGCLELTACVALTFFPSAQARWMPALLIYKEVAGALLLTIHAVFICWCLWGMLKGLAVVQRLQACTYRAWRRIRGRMSLRCCHSKCQASVMPDISGRKMAFHCCTCLPLPVATPVGSFDGLSGGSSSPRPVKEVAVTFGLPVTLHHQQQEDAATGSGSDEDKPQDQSKGHRPWSSGRV